MTSGGLTIIDGKKLAEKVRREVAEQVVILRQSGIIPRLDVVLVGDNPASKRYVDNKKKRAAEAGIQGVVHSRAGSTTQDELDMLIVGLNQDPSVHGILVQLPLPRHLDSKKIMNSISPHKDVDGFSPFSLGKLMLDETWFVPCTPQGVMRMFEEYRIPLSGRHAVVVGRSVIVGKPLSLLLLRKNATVTVCHSRTANLAGVCREADILCVAVGKRGIINGDMVKKGAVVIDIGINLEENGQLTGDVAFDSVCARASHITPVPGGVGPMTIAMLLKNTVQAAAMVPSTTLYA